MRLIITVIHGKKSREITTGLVTKDGIDHTQEEVCVLAKKAGMYNVERVSGWRTVYSSNN